MTPTVVYTARARRDIKQEWVYLHAESGAATADRFIEALERTSTQLAAMPYMGRSCGFDAPSAASTRRFPLNLPFGNWLIFYEPRHGGIAVQRIAHGARDLRGWL